MASKDSPLLVDSSGPRLGSNEIYGAPLEVGFPSDSLDDEEPCLQPLEPTHKDQAQPIYPVNIPASCSGLEELFVNEGVFNALQAAYKNTDANRGSAEYYQVAAAYEAIMHIFDPVFRAKYEEACRPENVEYWRRVYEDGEVPVPVVNSV